MKKAPKGLYGRGLFFLSFLPSASHPTYMASLICLESHADSSFQNRDPKFWEFVKKACVKLMKVLSAIQSRHPYSFGDKCVLPVVVDFCLNKITDPEQPSLPFEEFFIQCMVMVKSVLECKEYKPVLTGRVMDENGVTFEQRKKNASNTVSGIVSSLLPNERIVLLCNILVRR